MKFNRLNSILALAWPVLVLVSACAVTEVEKVAVNPDNLGFYRETWQESRANFLGLAGELAKSGARMETGIIPVPGATDKDLAIDWFYLPPLANKGSLVVVSSGVHGAEGFAGSAVQAFLMKEVLPARDRAATGYLFIHGINPYGMKHWRRFTENNVDLNRNAPISPDVYATKNDGYRGLDSFLNPAGKVETGSFEELTFPVRLLFQVLTKGMKNFRQASLGGQYEFKDGIFYGGAGPEPQMAPLGRLMAEKAKGYGFVLGFDLHTGVGRRGYMHVMMNVPKDQRYRAACERLFAGHPLDWPEGEDFYVTNGDFTTYLETLTAPVPTVSVTIEFGTLDSQELFGSIKSLRNMVQSNRGRRFGYAGPADENLVKENFREMFLPSSRVWRSEVIRQARETLPAVIARLPNFKY